ncbi:NitT/TauT family transport system ATP-binding protein [Paenibacillus sp. UNCCL117]|uniref:ABC transporter ATP-binding protein n=1 Tax=unclassified Paenibacillus TaxID=185978 RepID=UPI00088327E7|nr:MULTISPECIES: ABC transporter ATP-binding protein [unclassified Paenibacillus]SDD17140.1 NitT/TauT family transport system ATP-binding protein [Paenibacillus sp. cl123]SFW34891.1 NitT/TauT family transport system ATP-binding protein [Paenibacillus sp. UNCCL117]
MAGFEINDVSKIYGGSSPTETLSHIQLHIEDGEFLAILGPSGCGKSTLLDILAGLQPASSGEVLFEGKPLTGPGKERGVVFQDPSLYPWRTVFQNVELGLEIGGVPKPERKLRVQKYLDLVGLKGFEHKYPHHLSGGMRQRAGLARALSNSPKVLLMDEPFGAVDHLTRLQLQDDLLTIWQAEKKTVVFITHDVSEAVFLGDRVVLLSPRPGRIRSIFQVRAKRPRKRDDVELLKIQQDIYATIHEIKTEEDLEFTI